MNGETEILAADIIAENLLAQVDEEGHQQLLINEIEDHRIIDDAIPIDQGTFPTHSGMKGRRRMTKGWELSVRWKDGSSSWISLTDLKDTYPVDLADYAIANWIQDEPQPLHGGSRTLSRNEPPSSPNYDPNIGREHTNMACVSQGPSMRPRTSIKRMGTPDGWMVFDWK
jgi:hypothetical protein